MKFKHCNVCGVEYEQDSWPRTCVSCGDIHWRNPTPVVAVIQPVYDYEQERIGFVIAQRAINPFKGEWALVGGYVDFDDACIHSAGRREFLEETGLEIKSDLRIVCQRNNHHGNMVFVVAAEGVMDYADVRKATPCSENLAIGVAWQNEPVSLCFPIHQEVLERYL